MTPRILSEPIKVIWAGWQSDTYTLQRCGWQLSAQENVFDRGIILAIKHPSLRVHGYSDMLDFNHRVMGERSHDVRKYLERRQFIFNMQLAEQVQLHVMGEPHFKGVDATPTYTESKIKSLEDLAYFQAMPKPESDIILPPPSFDEILQMALDHQAPKQKELREKARRTMGHGMILRVAA